MIERKRLRAAFSLTLIGLLAALLLAGIDRLTADRIARAQQQRALATLVALLPAGSFDNDLIDDHVDLPISRLVQPARVYRARLEGEPAALIFDVTTGQGYSGDIRLLVAMDPDGVLLGVRVLDHRETPGLGDKIEVERSDWIRQFTGRSLGNPPAEGWRSDRRGGAFDTLTSATITTDAVIEAVRLSLEEKSQRPDRLWQAADPES